MRKTEVAMTMGEKEVETQDNLYKTNPAASKVRSPGTRDGMPVDKLGSWEHAITCTTCNPLQPVA